MALLHEPGAHRRSVPLPGRRFLGGSDEDIAVGLGLNREGIIFLTGRTRSTDFPTTIGVLSRTRNGLFHDIFVCKFNSNLTVLLNSTYIGGYDSEEGDGITFDQKGNVIVIGSTRSTNFPTTIFC